MKKVLLSASLLAAFAITACDQGKKDEAGSAKAEDKKSAAADKKSADAAKTGDAKPAGTTTADAKTGDTKPATTTDATAAPSGTSDTAGQKLLDVTKTNLGTREAPVTMPTQQSYSMDGIKTIDDSCSNAHVILVQAPESVGVDYEWKYSRQAMLANQQYQVVSGAPAVQGQVSFQVHQADEKMNKAYVLVANCADGVTCNHLAAMYKSIVKSSNPQVFCGEVPPHLGAKKKDVNLMEGGPQANLPKSDDTISKCARIAACTIADKTDTKEDVGISCQKSPQSFKLDCATRYPCAEVLACTK